MMFIVSAWTTVAAEEAPIQVRIDGELVDFTDAQPILDSNNRTLVPLRAIGEAMGLIIEWDSELRQATFTADYSQQELLEDDETEHIIFLSSENITFEIDKDQADFGAYWEMNEENEFYPYGAVEYDIDMDTKAVIIDSRTYAPVRYLAEAFNYNVSWDQSTRTVELNSLNGKWIEEVEVIIHYEDDLLKSLLLVTYDDTNVTAIDMVGVIVNGAEREGQLIEEEVFEDIEKELEAQGLSNKMLMGYEFDKALYDDVSYRILLKFNTTIDDEQEIFEWEYYIY